MFEELLSNTKERSIDKDILNIWSQQAAKSYIDEKTPLSEKLASISREENLNPTQIQRLVENTNLTTEAFLRQRGVNDFDIAKTEDVLEKLNMKNEKPMGTLGDYFSLPSEEYSQNLYDLFGVEPQKAVFMNDKQAAYNVHEKIAQKKIAANCHLANLEMKKEAQLKRIVEVAKQSIMKDKEDINELYKMAHIAGYGQTANDVFKLINFVLTEQEVIEKDAFRAPEQYISEDLKGKVKIINGNHPLLIAIKDLDQYNKGIEKTRQYIIKADDGLQAVSKRLKEL